MTRLPTTPAEPEGAELDAWLAARSAEGDRAAFDQLASRHLGRCYRLALRMTGDSAIAEDIAQEALLRAWRGIARFDSAKGRLTTWLHRIVINLAVDHLRAERPAHVEIPESLPDARAGAPELIAEQQRRRTLIAGIAALPERQRAAMVLSYFAEEPAAETGRKLGISSRAVEGLLRRGRHFLKEWLEAREV